MNQKFEYIWSKLFDAKRPEDEVLASVFVRDFVKRVSVFLPEDEQSKLEEFLSDLNARIEGAILREICELSEVVIFLR